MTPLRSGAPSPANFTSHKAMCVKISLNGA